MEPNASGDWEELMTRNLAKAKETPQIDVVHRAGINWHKNLLEKVKIEKGDRDLQPE